MRSPLRIRSYHIKRSSGGRVQLVEDTFYSRRRVSKVEKAEQKDEGAQKAS
jgi:hypothetical protein